MHNCLAYVLPVGPLCKVDFVRDTIDSIVFYDDSAWIICVDDSGQNVAERWSSLYKNLRVVKSAGKSGKGPGLFHVLACGYGHLCADELARLAGVVRLDTDALLIGSGLGDSIAKYFSGNREAGIIGSHKIASNGTVRDYSAVARRVKQLSSPVWPVRHPRRVSRDPRLLTNWLRFTWLVRKAIRNGYDPGEHCMGGAYVINPKLLATLQSCGLLSTRLFDHTGLEEDAIVAILSYAVGYRLADFATRGLPLGLKWRGLPAHPLELVRQDKKLIHSTRFYEEMSEEDIRQFFRKRREAHKVRLPG